MTNLTAGGTVEQIAELIRQGALKPLCDLLVVKETKIVTVILDALLNMLHVSDCCTVQFTNLAPTGCCQGEPS